MKITISFKNLKHTPSLDLRIKEKSSKLEKYFDNGYSKVDWVCYVKDGIHYAEVSVHGAHFEYHARANADNLYKTFDLATAKLEKQLTKKKERRKNKLHKFKRGTEIMILDPEQAWSDYHEDYIDEEVAS